MEGKAEKALTDLAAQQARAEKLDRQLTQARAHLTAAPPAGGADAAAEAALQAHAAAAAAAAEEAAAAAAAAHQMHERNTALQQEVQSLQAHVRRITSEQDAVVSPRPPSAALMRAASQLSPTASHQPDSSPADPLPDAPSAVPPPTPPTPPSPSLLPLLSHSQVVTATRPTYCRGTWYHPLIHVGFRSPACFGHMHV